MKVLPAPLVPADADIRGFQFMPVEVTRLLSSDTWIMANPCERGAAMTLWLASWQQVPAGSVPNNDKILAHLSMTGESWPAVRDMALRGWVLCSDGRFYHPVVCEKVNDAVKAQRQRREAIAKRWGKGEKAPPSDTPKPAETLGSKPSAIRPVYEPNTGLDTPVIQGRGRGRKTLIPTKNVSLTGDAVQALFEEFEEAMPSRGEAANPRKPAREMFARLVEGGTDPQEIIAGAKGYRAAMKRTKAEGTRFILRMTTFLSQAAWEQYLRKPTKGRGMTVEKWDRALRSFERNGTWHPDFGPRPGEPGCGAPAELVVNIVKRGEAA